MKMRQKQENEGNETQKIRRNEWKTMKDNKVNEMKKRKNRKPKIWKRNRENFEMSLEDRNETCKMKMKP